MENIQLLTKQLLVDNDYHNHTSVSLLEMTTISGQRSEDLNSSLATTVVTIQKNILIGAMYHQPKEAKI